MAILSLIAGVIGSVIVISSRTYRRGISETNIQQEAQLAANNIGNIVKNSYKVIYGANGNVLVESTEKDGDKEVEDGKAWDPRYTELSLITNEDIQYTMLYDSVAKVLVYQEYDTVNKVKRTDPQVMANKISKFEADTSMFKENRTIKLTMEVNDEATNRRIPMEYVMTSRNSEGEGEYVSSTDSLRIAFLEDEVVLVPGETSADIPIMVMGTVSGAMEFKTEDGDKVEDILGTGSVTVSDDYASVKVTVPRTVTDAVANKGVFFRIYTHDAGGNEVKSSLFKVHIRKVEKVAVNWTVDVSHTDSDKHMYEEAGSVFTFTAGVTGNRLAKDVAKDYDLHYETAQAVEWSWVVKYGDKEYTEADGNSNEFITVVESKTQEDVEVPQIIIKLNQNMSSGFSLTVTATSKHAHGVNKANSFYFDAVEADDARYYDSVTVTPREAVLEKEFEITLEPFEEGMVELGTKGGRPTAADVTFDFSERTDSTGTTAEYIPADDAVKITLGKDEKGSGAGGANPYTFKIGVKVKDVLKTTITVHVRRIDKIWVEIVQDKEVPKTYDFRARINVDKPQPNKQVTTDYLYVLKNKELYNTEEERKNNVADKEIVAQTLSSKITWEFYDYAKSKTKPQYSDWVICEGGVGTKGNVTSKSDGFKEEREYYQLTKGLKNSVKPARIQIYTEDDRVKDEKEGNLRASEVKVGEWYIRQYPEVDLTLKKGSLPANTELRVTIEMLHSQGHNKNNSTYHNRQEWVVYASESIYGNRIYTDSEIVVVEPGQGNDSYKQSDEEIVIPIHSEGEDQDDKVVSYMTATIENSEKTRLSKYPDGQQNPYRFNTLKGKSEWLLGLVIDKEEHGDDNGFVTVKVEAFDKDKTLLTQMDFRLAVRRVNDIEVKVKDNVKINDINKVGNTVTLEAYPTGEGDKGTAYYGVQTKNYINDDMGFDITIKDDAIDTSDTVCRWEKKDHGRYRSPLAMEWTMVINGKESALAEWTDYIEKPVPDTVPGDYKMTVAFKLKQPLPAGTRIRAYSLHARGKVGNTKYNKSGKEYDEVYGELVIGGSYVVADGFQRSEDWDFASNNKLTTNDSVIPNIRSYFTDDIYKSNQRTFFRYKEVGTEWNATNKQYRTMDSTSERAAFFSGNLGSRLFLPNKEYELEIINVVYGTGRDNGKKVIYWPQDPSLLEDGKGWKEEGYELWDGTWGYNITSWEEITPGNWGSVTRSYKEVYELMKQTPKSEYYYLIPKSEIYFDKYVNQWRNDYDTIDSKVKTIGSESNPKKLSHDAYYDRHFMVKIEPTSIHIDKTQAHFTAQVDKWENGKWVFMEALTQTNQLDENKYKWFMNVSLPTSDIYHVRSDASGKYRIRSTITGMEWAKITGGLFDTGDSRYQKYVVDSIEMFNTSDGSGIMYIQLN